LRRIKTHWAKAVIWFKGLNQKNLTFMIRLMSMKKKVRIMTTVWLNLAKVPKF